MNLALGGLRELWCARCCECKKVLPMEQPVTRHGARMTLDNLQWSEGPHGWICKDCRLVSGKR